MKTDPIQTEPATAALDRANMWRGVLLMSVAFLLYSLSDLVAKLLTADFHAVQIGWTRQLGLLSGVIFLLIQRGFIVFHTKRPGLQIARGVIASTSPVLFTMAVAQISLADAVAVSFVAPFLVVIFGALMLNEHISRKQFFGILGAFIGTLIIVRPGLGVFQFGTVFVLLAATAFALRQVISRMVAGVDRTSTTVAYAGTVSVLVLSFILPFYWKTPETLYQYGLFFLVALTAGFGEFFIIRALDITFAVILAPLQYTMIIWSIIWGWMFFADLPDSWTLIGTAIIIISGILTSGVMRYLKPNELKTKLKRTIR